MHRDLTRAGFRLAMLICVPSLFLVILEPRGSAQQIVALMALGVGVIFLLVVLIMAHGRGRD